MPQNVIKLPQIIQATENTLKLANGQTFKGIDTVIYCTGYRYSFPFIDPKILQLKNDGKSVSPLFEHVAHRDFVDSFFVIGLNYWAVASMLFDTQVNFAIALMKGEANGFTKDDVDQWEEKRARYN